MSITDKGREDVIQMVHAILSPAKGGVSVYDTTEVPLLTLTVGKSDTSIPSISRQTVRVDTDTYRASRTKKDIYILCFVSLLSLVGISFIILVSVEFIRLLSLFSETVY